MARFKFEKIASQILLLDQERNFGYFHLQEPYYMAAREFDWSLKVPGIGVNNHVLTWLLSKKSKIRVFVGPQSPGSVVCYQADPERWITFAFVHNSIFKPPGKWGLELSELPWYETYFETILSTKDPKIEEVWKRLSYFEATGRAITGILEGFSNE